MTRFPAGDCNDLWADGSVRRHGQAPATATPGPRIHSLTDATSQGLLQHWVEVDVHQLGAGPYQGACTTLSAGNFHLVHEQQNRLVHKTGLLPKNACTVSMFLSRGPAMRFSHFRHPDNSQVFLLPAQTEIDIQVPGGVDTLYVCIEQDRLMAGARALNPRFWERAPRGLHSYHTPAADRLAADLTRLLDPLRLSATRQASPLSAQSQTLLLDTILLTLDQAAEVVTGDTPDYLARRRTHQRVKAAREFIDASLRSGRLPSIVDICAETGASARTLQYAFREVMQLSPVAYLRILRLNKVRATLQYATSAETTVTRIASDWGFFHLGEFARDYQQLFGEYPSETLGRALCRAAG